MNDDFFVHVTLYLILTFVDDLCILLIWILDNVTWDNFRLAPMVLLLKIECTLKETLSLSNTILVVVDTVAVDYFMSSLFQSINGQQFPRQST